MDGNKDGMNDGFEEGFFVGAPDGMTLGVELRCSDGDNVGL